MIKYKSYLESDRIYFRDLVEEDIDNGYYNWLNDPEVSRYLETRYSIQTKNKIKQFIIDQTASPNVHLFAICFKENDTHIGNIKLGPINFLHRRGDLSYLIGRKEYWGKGLGSESVEIIIEFAKKTLNLHKIDAGVYEENIGSYRVLIKNGFKEQGRIKDHWYLNNKYQDEILLSKIL